MKATLLALGSRGDVQPYLALGVGLKRAGHNVMILTSIDFQELVESYGLEFHDVGAGSMQAIAQEMSVLLETGNFLKILASMGETSRRMAGQAAKSGLAACRGADLIVAGLGGLFDGAALAQKLDIPFVQAFYYPFTPTGEFPNALAPLPGGLRLPAFGNRLTHRAVQQMMWQNFRTGDQLARREVLHIPPASFWGPFAALERRQTPTLYGYSPLVLPPPEDWGPAVHVTGYWFLDPPSAWEPAPELVDFLQSGPPPIYVGFGSMVNRDPRQTANLVIEALARSGQRGVLSMGWGGLQIDDLPPAVFVTGPTPFHWLFPQMAAVVHHGGAGTTAEGLRAGVPSILVPFMGDQPFWGQRVFELGVGPAPIPRKSLTVERLAEAMRGAVEDTAMCERAARLGAAIRAEDGVARAVRVMEDSLS